MIPVRVPATFVPYVTADNKFLVSEHEPYGRPCPVCGGTLGIDGEPVSLVAVGVSPERRQTAGWMSAGAATVHTACTLTVEESGSALEKARQEAAVELIGRLARIFADEAQAFLIHIGPDPATRNTPEALRMAHRTELLNEITQTLATEVLGGSDPLGRGYERPAQP